MNTSDARASEVAGKLDRLRAVLRERGLGAAALSARRNFAWLTAGGDNHVLESSETGVATLLVTEREAVVLTTVIEAARIRDEELRGLPIEVVGLPWELPDAVGAEIRRRASGTVATDDALEGDLRRLRMVLTEDERTRFVHLGERTASAVTRTLAGVAVGDLETVIAQRLSLALAEDAIAGPVILVASDGRIPAYRHPIPKPKAAERSVMLVVGAEQGGLVVAMTRMVWLGAPPDDEIRRRYESCTRIHRALRAATRTGEALDTVFDAGIAAYRAEGHGHEWLLHHQGGPIGYQGREIIATPTTRDVIEGGMAFAWNPSITGAKVEDTFILAEDGTQTIVTRDPAWPVDDRGEPAIWVRDGAGASA
jgi:Xaa-Pro aminopeptidase